VAGTFECGNEPWGYLTYEEYLDWLKTDQLLKKDCAAWSKYSDTSANEDNSFRNHIR